MRAATNWLYYSLKDHPEIYINPKKEIHFIDNSTISKKGLEFMKIFSIKNEKIKFAVKLLSQFI